MSLFILGIFIGAMIGAMIGAITMAFAQVGDDHDD